jgi:transcriptional regulator with XRE-family HTH domain
MADVAFAARLKTLREAAGLTQKQLAEKAGVAQRTVSSLEQGLYEPVWSTVLALARALAVPVQAFVPEEDDQGEGQGATTPPVKQGRGRPRKDIASTEEKPNKPLRGSHKQQ